MDMKDELKYVLMEFGVLFVIIVGTPGKQLQFVSS